MHVCTMIIKGNKLFEAGKYQEALDFFNNHKHKVVHIDVIRKWISNRIVKCNEKLREKDVLECV